KKPDSSALQFDLGTAAYKTGNMDRAIENFSNAVTSSDAGLREKAEYNLANSLVQRGLQQKEEPVRMQELKNGLQHYDAALKIQPKDADAQYNRGVVTKLLEELKKQQQQQQQQQKDKQQKDQQGKDQQQQDGQKQDQSQEAQEAQSQPAKSADAKEQ